MTVAALRSIASNSALRGSLQRAKSNPALRQSTAAAASIGNHRPAPPLPTHFPSTPVRPFVSTVLLTRDAYESKRVAELKTELKQRGLTTTGKRVDLIQRLLKHDQECAKVLPLASSTTSTASLNATSKRHASSAAPQQSAGAVVLDAEGATIAPPEHMETGQVSANFHDPAVGVVAPDVLEADANAPPGVPPEKMVNAPRTFAIEIPYEEIPVEAQAVDVPLMTSYFHPEEAHFGGHSDAEGPLAHMPKVQTVSGEETYLGGGVAHHHPEFEHNLESGTAGESGPSATSFSSAVSSLMSSVQKDLGLGTSSSKQSQQVGSSTRKLWKSARDTLSNATGASRTGGNSGSSSASYSTSSTSSSSNARPLSEEERRGAYVLAGIVAGGFLLGGLGKQSKRKAGRVESNIKESIAKMREESKTLSESELNSLVERAESALKK